MPNNNPRGINQYTGGRFSSAALKTHKDLRQRREYIAGVDPAKVLARGGVASKGARKSLATALKKMRAGYGIAGGKTTSSLIADVSHSTAIRNSTRRKR